MCGETSGRASAQCDEGELFAESAAPPSESARARRDIGMSDTPSEAAKKIPASARPSRPPATRCMFARTLLDARLLNGPFMLRTWLSGRDTEECTKRCVEAFKS